MGEQIGIPPYTAYPTLARFHASRKFIRGVKGPFGSGKTSGMCMEILGLALTQVPSPRTKVREGRIGIIRNTYGELKSTTIKTWTEWFPEDVFGSVKYDLPHSHNIRFSTPETGPVHIEAFFLALDKPKDVKKLKSLNLTWAWINEANEVAKMVLDMLSGRVNRYPPVRDGGATHPCVMMDYNPPNPESWLFEMAEEATPSNAEFFHQPPAIIQASETEEDHSHSWTIRSSSGKKYAVNPEAENIDWVAKDGIAYYENLCEGKDDDFIHVYGKGNYGYIKEGKAVYAGYRDEVHFSETPLTVYTNLPLLLMMDFGLKCGALLAQLTPKGKLRVVDELYTEDGLDVMIDLLDAMMANSYPGMKEGKKVHGWGDPAGSSQEGIGKRTSFKTIQDAGYNIIPSPIPTNAWLPRKEAVDKVLGKLDGLLIGPNCKMLRAGFLGQYKLAPSAVVERGRIVHKDVPVKNSYSHIHDAFQYGVIGIKGGIPEAAAKAFQANIARGLHTTADREAGY